MYAVTAKHVIDAIRENTLADTVYLTYNGENGKEETAIPLSEWHFHPGDSTENVDVAIARFEYKTPEIVGPRFANPRHVKCWMTESLINVSAAKNSGIGLGQEVSLAGLFVHHQGSTRNIPIVRSGSIAAMPGEKVSTQIGPITAYLLEVRSIGGLSRSPVFTESSGNLLLIGLVHGHFDQRTGDLDACETDGDSPIQPERINAGIAIVVPADRIRETLRPLTDADFHSIKT